MEAAGPSVGQATPGQPASQLSPKKSPKRHPNRAQFKPNSKNSSPKRSLNNPNFSFSQNVPVSIPMSYPNQVISTPILTFENNIRSSGNRSYQEPFPKRLSKVDPFSAAIETCVNKSTPTTYQENAASQVPEVHSLMITVHNNTPFQRVVQNDVQPQRFVQNDATQSRRLEGNETPERPYQSKFPQATSLQCDPVPIKLSHQQARSLVYQQTKKAQRLLKQANAATQPQRIVQNDVQPERFVQNDVQPQRIVQNDVQPQRIVQNDVQPQRIVQNDVQPPRIVQNDVQPYRIIQNDVQREVTPGRSYQPRFPQSKRSQHNPPQRGEWQTCNKGVVEPTPNAVQQSEQEDGEASGQPQLNYKQKKLYQQDPNYFKKVIVLGFPAYTKPEELVRKLSILGHSQLETFKNRVAVLVFSTEHEALTALQANETIAVYGTILTIMKFNGQRHVMSLIKANRRVLKSEGGPPIISPTQLDLSGDFKQQLDNIENAIRLTQEEVANINLLFEDIEMYMRKVYPMCEAVPFGSITTGQGIKSSDADCFLSMVPGTDGRPGVGAAEHCSQFVSRAVRFLRLYPEVFSQLVAIPRANTPIIKFLHVPTNVNCDLNSKTPLGVQNSRLVGHLLSADPRFGSLALLLKYWARVHQLSGTGRLTNYALLLLVVFYLQQTLLPPVSRLQGPIHSFPIENWEAGFDRSPISLARDVPPLRELLGGFFVYYAGFNFDENVVCPLVGRPMRKAEFESNVLPVEFALYRRNILAGFTLPVRTTCTLCIQDPFELSHNVASSVTCRLAVEIKAHLKLAASAFMQEERSPGEFLRTALLTRPACLQAPVPREGRAAQHRVSLPARLLAELSEDWQRALRDAVVDNMYKNTLLLDLMRKDHVSRDPDVDQEVYSGTARRPVWRRGFNPAPRGGDSGAEVLARHQEISQRILTHSPQIEDVYVPFELELGFRNKPPRAFTVALIPLEGADEDEFKAFRTFVNTFVHRWQRVLLSSYLMADLMRVAANNAKPPPPKKSNKKSPKKPNKENNVKEKSSKEMIDKATEPRVEKPPKPPIETVAFVNSNHKDMSDSLAAVSLECPSENSTHDNDAS